MQTHPFFTFLLQIFSLQCLTWILHACLMAHFKIFTLGNYYLDLLVMYIISLLYAFERIIAVRQS